MLVNRTSVNKRIYFLMLNFSPFHWKLLRNILRLLKYFFYGVHYIILYIYYILLYYYAHTEWTTRNAPNILLYEFSL